MRLFASFSAAHGVSLLTCACGAGGSGSPNTSKDQRQQLRIRRCGINDNCKKTYVTMAPPYLGGLDASFFSIDVSFCDR
jgi:hypothetical protein